MRRLNITAKIWLSVGVFILGYVLSTALSQIQGREACASLRATSEALFPAAQRSQEAEAAFQRMVKGFGDAVVMQDASGLDRAAEDGRQAVAALKAVAAIPAFRRTFRGGRPPGLSVDADAGRCAQDLRSGNGPARYRVHAGPDAHAGVANRGGQGGPGQNQRSSWPPICIGS